MQWFSWCRPLCRASTFFNNLFLNIVIFVNFVIQTFIFIFSNFLQNCKKSQLKCHIKTYCQGIHCQCCEELRCFSHQESLSLESEKPKNGSLVVQNCTDAFTPNLYQTYCQGYLHDVIEQFAFEF